MYTMGVHDRIKRVVKYLVGQGIAKNQEGVGELLGYTNKASFSHVLNNRKPLPIDFVERLSSLDEKLNVLWINTGEGEMLSAPKFSEAREIDPNYIDVPFIPLKAIAGYLSEFDNVKFIEELPTLKVQTDRTFHGKYRCFEVSGDSMNDGSIKSICDGDIILAREVQRHLWEFKLHINQWFFVINHIDGLLIKQIVDHDVENGTITCHSLNSIYGEDFKLNLKEVRELYNVIKITDRVLKI